MKFGMTRSAFVRGVGEILLEADDGSGAAGGASGTAVADEKVVGADAESTDAAPEKDEGEKATEDGTEPSTIAGGSDEEASEGDKTPETVTYEDFTVPEGMQLDEGMLEKFTPIAGRLGLDQEAAQEIVSLYAGAVEAGAKESDAAFKTQQEAWVNEITEDADFGEQKFAETQRLNRRLVAKYGGKELQDALNVSGLGNHPALVKMFARIGALFSEDSLVVGGDAPTGPETTMAQRFYPKMKDQLNPK